MLEQKLEEASRRFRRQLMILLGAVIILILAGVAAIFVAQQGLPTFGSPPAEQAGARDDTSPLTKDVAETPEPPVVRLPPATEHPPASEPARSRDEVVQAIGRYEQQFEPTITAPGFAAWNVAVQDEFARAKDSVITNLANGATDRAFEGANELLSAASAAVEAYEAAYLEAMMRAAAAYEADDYNGALLEVNRALGLKPGDGAANDLLQKITHLPEILDLIKKARVAKVENDLEEELAFSREIVRLDDQRVSYRERVSEIERELAERRYAGLIAAGIEAIKRENVGAANAAYKQAAALFPAREETKNLSAALQDLTRKINFRQLVKNGDTAIREDNWPAAMGFYQDAAALYPDNAEVLETISMVEQILRHDAEVTRLLQSPERLSAANVRAEAERAVGDADLFRAMSASLARNIDALQAAIARQNREIEVWVVSDKLTTVSVRSVGQVGQVDRYRIRLKPGQYVFEGRREGYRTKAVPVTISPEDNQVEVTVISDERI